MGLMQTKRCLPGFTLVELMIVLVIASILGAIAYPSYRDHLTRAGIPEATGGLSLYAARLQEYYLDHRSYQGSEGRCALPAPDAGKFSFNPSLSPAEVARRRRENRCFHCGAPCGSLANHAPDCKFRREREQVNKRQARG